MMNRIPAILALACLLLPTTTPAAAALPEGVELGILDRARDRAEDEARAANDLMWATTGPSIVFAKELVSLVNGTRDAAIWVNVTPVPGHVDPLLDILLTGVSGPEPAILYQVLEDVASRAPHLDAAALARALGDYALDASGDPPADSAASSATGVPLRERAYAATDSAARALQGRVVIARGQPSLALADDPNATGTWEYLFTDVLPSPGLFEVRTEDGALLAEFRLHVNRVVLLPGANDAESASQRRERAGLPRVLVEATPRAEPNCKPILLGYFEKSPAPPHETYRDRVASVMDAGRFAQLVFAGKAVEGQCAYEYQRTHYFGEPAYSAILQIAGPRAPGGQTDFMLTLTTRGAQERGEPSVSGPLIHETVRVINPSITITSDDYAPGSTRPDPVTSSWESRDARPERSRALLGWVNRGIGILGEWVEDHPAWGRAASPIAAVVGLYLDSLVTQHEPEWGSTSGCGARCIRWLSDTHKSISVTREPRVNFENDPGTPSSGTITAEFTLFYIYEAYYRGAYTTRTLSQQMSLDLEPQIVWYAGAGYS